MIWGSEGSASERKMQEIVVNGAYRCSSHGRSKKAKKDSQGAYAVPVMSIRGLNELTISSLVPTISLGILLTRFAPVRTAILPAADIPERFDRMDPASEALAPGSRIRGGGAKSSPVNVLDLRSMCLYRLEIVFVQEGGTHGLGITARSS